MWRIYSRDKDGVKVKTTIRKLFQPIYLAGGEYYKGNGTPFNLSSFVGKVKYSNTTNLTQMLKDKKRMSDKVFDQTGWEQASTFFFKRIAFKHEQEVRVIFNSQFNKPYDTHKIDIDPFSLFDKIVFDPRMEKNEYEIRKQQVKDRGYKNSVYQSSLYKLRNFTVMLEPD